MSPDGRHIVSLEAETVTVQHLSVGGLEPRVHDYRGSGGRGGGEGRGEGDEAEEAKNALPTLQMAFEIHTDLHVSGIAFVPSQSGMAWKSVRVCVCVCVCVWVGVRVFYHNWTCALR